MKRNHRGGGWSTSILAGIMVALGFMARPVTASDHADPIDVFNSERLEGGITDLFVFPVLESGEVALPHVRTSRLPLVNPEGDIPRPVLSEADQARIKALVVVLCVRRALTQSGSLKLTPYIYKVHFDLDTPIVYPQPGDEAKMPDTVPHEHGDEPPHSHAETVGYSAGFSSGGAGEQKPRRPTVLEAFARYGGWIAKEDASRIREEITIEFRLDDRAMFQPGYPRYVGPRASGWNGDSRIRVASGVYDDPFIFPVFFGTNVVAMVAQIPLERFQKEPGEELRMAIWGTSHKGSRQVDHVGRSLRTQNPRFELLNTRHPSLHVSAIESEHEHPSLMRDIFLRLNFNQTFAFREWDFVPDVMLYSTRYQCGFPNGRLLTDDVAAMLAQHGDTLLYELSYHNATFPRQSVNDKEFRKTFPFLADKHDDRAGAMPTRLSGRSIWKLIGLVLLILVAIIGAWELIKWGWRWWKRRTKNSERVL